jgi:mono/diheme cytochrome c family protein
MRYLIPGVLILAALILLTLLSANYSVDALPEYSTRTGEPCGTCHVSAGGGGPRTLRGLLWAAQGKPDKVPPLPSTGASTKVTEGAEIELYQDSCGGCHGMKGEGLSAIRLVNTNISLPAIRVFTLQGIPKLGMPAFAGKFNDEQLNALTAFVAGISSGAILPPADSYPLPPPLFKCDPIVKDPVCIHPLTEMGGN